MSTLTDVKLDLIAINLIDDKPIVSPLLSYLLTDLGDDLTGSGITNINLPIISTSYKVDYGTVGNDVIDLIGVVIPPQFNPYFDINALPPPLGTAANHIIVAGAGDDIVVGGYGNDIILGGDGNDTLMGVLGRNILDGGNGDDQMFGAISAFTFHSSEVTPGLSNTLFGGDGNDTLAGQAGNILLVHENNTNINVTNQGSFLYGGNGDDFLYGYIINEIGIVLNVSGEVYNVTMQSSFLDGGAGNDTLVGFIGNESVEITNSQGTFQFFFGSDTLIGGSGNDTLIGDYGSLSITATGSSASNIHLFGNDLLQGGSGDDLLIGDAQTLSMVFINSPSWHQEEHYGADTLIGGTGNDTLVGDVQNIPHMDGQQFFGSDTFVISLNGNFGNDKILDMNAGGVLDNLKFTDVGGCNPGVSDVNNKIQSFSDDGHGGLLVTFKNGLGSIDFADIAYTHQTSIDQVTPGHIIVM